MTKSEIDKIMPGYQAYLSIQHNIEALRHYGDLLTMEDPTGALLITLTDKMLADLPVLLFNSVINVEQEA
ncbi:hypothetical protein IC617_09335 [Neiella sp. HB171785]|uniref:Uncharacterized protein n=1 Tax=Neiella litorisoli TaxID=2771431 RepID=A0A8J6QUB8_9GAMM|nr:hypothetical protein [Neiella litorisoli]MBD1389632.1 hypothetical protein [Neiella litorisoli]